MGYLAYVFALVLIFAMTPGSGFSQSDRLVKSITLTKTEKKALDVSLPPSVRAFLETAEKFEVYAQLEVIDGKLQPAMGRELVPNFKAEVTGGDKRQKLLKSLYSEAAKDEGPAICYLPSHSIVASKGDQKVTVEICFGCNRFYVSGTLGESKGTFSHARGETERLISKLVTESGVTTK